MINQVPPHSSVVAVKAVLFIAVVAAADVIVLCWVHGWGNF